MRAVVVGPAGPELRDVPMPSPRPHEILVRVRAAALNRTDLMMAEEGHHGSLGGSGTILGLEMAGEVVAGDAETASVVPGDRVMCPGSGCFAEYAVADRGRVMPVPDGMDFLEGATLPVALQTMHDAIVTNGRLKAGETVLIQGASAGVGLIGLQIAKHKGARMVMGTSTNDARRARLCEFGADLALDSRDPTWPDRVIEATGGKGVDLIIDLVSAGVASQNMKAVRVLGRIVNIGRLGGLVGEFDFDLHATKRIDYIGASFRTRSVAEVREIVRRLREDLGAAVGAGRFRLPIDRVFPLEAAPAALAHMRANAHFGKIVLET